MLEMVGFLQGAADNFAWLTIDRLLGLVGLALAFVAIWFAYHHVKRLSTVLDSVRAVLGQAELQREQATSHANRLDDILDDIKESLSTRYLGEFPNYFPKIVDVIKEAKESVIILCDYPGYGSFTDRETWQSYKHAIEQKLLKGVEIELTCFNEDIRRATLDERFFNLNEWDKWKLEQDSVKRLEKLLKWNKDSTPVSDLSKEQFFELLACEERVVLAQTFPTAKITQIDTYVPLYFWIADEKLAVFAIASVSNKEYGFFTFDRQIIQALIAMRNRYHPTPAIHPAP